MQTGDLVRSLYEQERTVAVTYMRVYIYIYIYMYIYIYIAVLYRGAHPEPQFAVATKFCTMPPNFVGS